jgi:hypothetical protein
MKASSAGVSSNAPDRDEIEFENRVRFFRQAIATANQTKKKRQAVALNADLNLARSEKLVGTASVSESELREHRYLAEAAKLEVLEQDHIIRELEMDAEIAELNRRWAAGELEDLATIASYHFKRWKNIADLYRITLQRAKAYQEWTEWNFKTATKLLASNATSQAEVDTAALEVSLSQTDYDQALIGIAEAEKSADEAKATLERLNNPAPNQP